MIAQNPLEPLYKPWEEPTHRREKNPAGGRSLIQPGRRPSRALLVPYIRSLVNDWRYTGYPGTTATTKILLNHWFDTAHPDDFKYHYCQREAVETAIWLYEVAKYRCLSDLFASLIPESENLYGFYVKSVTDDEDLWARYCSKIATGGGKTKCMSLLIAWSYFNSLYEDPPAFPRQFVLIAPNLIVFDRLLEDFRGASIFFRDPVLPPDFAEDFSLEVVEQDAAGGGTGTGTLYLTNIHRLFEHEKTQEAAATPSWAGPDVKKAQVYKVGERLRSRIAEHPGIMVLNDEAHHLHDPGSAWNEAIRALHDQGKTKGNAGVQIQLDFSATPKHNDGNLFRHIVSDFPLGEAVDAGIVKVPVIGKSDELKPFEMAADAFEEYRNHLILGYKQYEAAFTEWEGTSKPVLFVMAENATKANEIAAKLGSDDRFPLLKGKVLNLHTRLKGRPKNVGTKKNPLWEWETTEKDVTPDDLKFLRNLSTQLDEPNSPYRCIVSVLMLREGWDVRNVTTVVPLRPYTAKSNILAEQTLGRGLRRMTRPGETLERVTVVEHSAFTRFYQEELEQEGLDIEVEDLGGSKPQTVTIFVDFKEKLVETLEIEVPHVSDAIETTTSIDALTFDELKELFARRFTPLPISAKRSGTIHFEERTLFTDEIVRKFELDRGLLQLGSTAISVYIRELEKVCKLQSATAVLAPLLQRFIEEVLFDRNVSIYSGEIDHRMGDIDVTEHIRATFTPLIRSKTTRTEQRKRINSGRRLSTWRNFQATRSERKPCIEANKTMFNLVPCDGGFEAEFVDFLDVCDDVAAFAKNAGPQKLMLDYLAPNGRPAIYWPDFIVRLTNKHYILVELKGVEDSTAPLKAKAALEWCKAASTSGTKWNYLYLTMPIFEQNSEFSVEALVRGAGPKLKSLIESITTSQLPLPFDQTPEDVRKEKADKFLAGIDLKCMPEAVHYFVDQAVNQLDYDRRMGNKRFNLAFSILLEPFEALCGQLLQRQLGPHIPPSYDDRRYYYQPYLDNVPDRIRNELDKHQRNLQRNLTHNAHSNRIGNLMFCLSFAVDPAFASLQVGGVWDDVKSTFGQTNLQLAAPILYDMNNFRNRRVVHVEDPITDLETAETNLVIWVKGLAALCVLTT